MNNDVLFPDGAMDRMAAGIFLEGLDLAVASSTRHGGNDVRKPHRVRAEVSDEDDSSPAGSFLAHPLSFDRVGRAVADLHCPLAPGSGFVGFDWALSRKAYGRLRGGRDGLFNVTETMNFGQEAWLASHTGSMRRAVVASNFVYHYRGQTLGECKNGHIDCAFWEVGHHADVNRDKGWAKKEKDQLRWMSEDRVWWTWQDGGSKTAV